MSRTSTGSSSPRDAPGGPGTVPERPEEVDAALRRLGVRPSRRLGQSFLTDAFAADALAALAFPEREEPVVEVGGGLGILTRALLLRGVRSLTVVEKDPRLAAHLTATFGEAVRVVCEDALRFEPPHGAILTGSLPYSVATPLLFAGLGRRLPRIAVLVQKEVAERFAASPGSREYGRPSILARLYGDAELFQEVPSGSFYPRPQVAGRLLVLRARVGKLPVASVPRLEAVVRVLFSSRRKQLGNLLPRLTEGAVAAEELARRAGWPADWARLRPEALSPERFFDLVSALDSPGLRPRAPPAGRSAAPAPREAPGR